MSVNLSKKEAVLQLCNFLCPTSLSEIKDLSDGEIFMKTIQVKFPSYNLCQSDKSKHENTNPAIEDNVIRFNHIQNFIDDQYKIQSQDIISYSSIIHESSELELTKVALFILSEIVRCSLETDKENLQTLFHLEIKYQVELEECFHLFISDRIKITKSEVENLLSKGAENESPLVTPRRSSSRRRQKSVSSSKLKEDIFSNSPLKAYFESPVFKIEDIEMKNKQIKNLEKIMDEEEKESLKVQDQLEEAEKTIKEKDYENRQLQKQNEELKEDNQLLNNQLLQCESDVNHLKEENKRLHAFVKKNDKVYVNRIIELKAEIDVLKETIKEKKCQENLKNVENWKSASPQDKNVLISASESIKENEVLKEDNQKLQLKVHELKRQISDLLKEEVKKNPSVGNLNQSYEDLWLKYSNERTTNINQSFEEMRRKSAEFKGKGEIIAPYIEADNRNMSSQLKEAKLIINKKTSKLNEANLKIEELSSELNEANLKVETLSSEFNEVYSKFEELTSELNEVNLKNKELTSELNEVNLKVKELTSELNKSNLKVKELTSELNKSNLKVKELTKDRDLPKEEILKKNGESSHKKRVSSVATMTASILDDTPKIAEKEKLRNSMNKSRNLEQYHLLDESSYILNKSDNIATEQSVVFSELEIKPDPEKLPEAVLWKTYCQSSEIENTHTYDNTVNSDCDVSVDSNLDFKNNLEASINKADNNETDSSFAQENKYIFGDLNFNLFLEELKKLTLNGSFEKVLQAVGKSLKEINGRKRSNRLNLQEMLKIVTDSLGLAVALKAESLQDKSCLTEESYFCNTDKQNEIIGELKETINTISHNYEQVENDKNLLQLYYKKVIKERDEKYKCLYRNLAETQLQLDQIKKNINDVEGKSKRDQDSKKRVEHEFITLKSDFKKRMRQLRGLENKVETLESDAEKLKSENLLLKNKLQKLAAYLNKLRQKYKTLEEKKSSKYEITEIKEEEPSNDLCDSLPNHTIKSEIQETANESTISEAFKSSKNLSYYVSENEEDFNYVRNINVFNNFNVFPNNDERAEEIKRRNSLLPIHLQSSYPTENLPTASEHLYITENPSNKRIKLEHVDEEPVNCQNDTPKKKNSRLGTPKSIKKLIRMKNFCQRPKRFF